MHSIKHIYFIDKNILDDIRHLNEQKTQKHLSFNKKIDRCDSAINPMLAVLEGKNRTLPTRVQLIENLFEANREINFFYKNAINHGELLINNTANFIDDFAILINTKIPELLQSTKDLQKLLCRTYKDSEVLAISSCVKDIADKYSISIHHPLFVTAIYCLYENKAARGVLKPKENPTDGDAYNAAIDIRLLMSFLHLRQIFQSLDKNLEIHLFTMDKNLNDLQQVLCIDAENTSSETATDISCKIKIEFMPSLFNKTPKTQERHLNEIENLFNKNISRAFYSVSNITVSFVKPPRA